MHLELFGVTSTPKDGQLKRTRKSLGQFKTRDELLKALADHKVKGAHLVTVDHERKQAIEHVLERKNYRVRAVEYDFKAPKKSTKSEAATS